jgi:hypothetical protein
MQKIIFFFFIFFLLTYMQLCRHTIFSLKNYQLDPEPTPDPIPFFSDLKDAKNYFFFFIFFLLTYMQPCRHTIFSLKNYQFFAKNFLIQFYFASIISVRSTLLWEQGRIRIRTSDYWIRARETQRIRIPNTASE